MEGNPEVFTRFAQYGAIDRVRAAVAAYVGADVDDVVLVDNASHGMNAVFRSLAERLGRDALVLDLNTVYGMVRNTLAYTEATFGQRVVTANLTSLGGVVSDDGVVEIVRRALEAAGGAIKLVSVSHITSTPALVLPVARLSALAHAHGALIVVDGAHVMGQIPLDVPSIGCDYYVSNGHKWLSSPKGSAFLWVAKAEQPRIFPTTISQEGQGSSRYVRDFSYEGTDDPTARPGRRRRDLRVHCRPRREGRRAPREDVGDAHAVLGRRDGQRAAADGERDDRRRRADRAHPPLQDLRAVRRLRRRRRPAGILVPRLGLRVQRHQGL